MATDNPREVWRRGTSLSLHSPVGYRFDQDQHAATSELVYIDVAPAAVLGRDALTVVQGATGSGKSVTLAGILASMVALHGPDAMQLVLLDFKGASAFHGFAALPHTAAAFTDVFSKPAEWWVAVRETLDAEFDRRRRLLDSYGVSRATEYRERAMANPSMPSLPTLIIVADEYAEFLRNGPGVLSEIFTTALAGVAIGVHLMLGAQRVGLDDARFVSKLAWGLSLRVNDSAASLAVVGDKSAVGLPMPGVARLRHAGCGERDTHRMTLAAFNTMEGLSHRWCDRREAWVQDPSSTAQHRLLRRLSEFAGTIDDTHSTQLSVALNQV